MGIGLIVIIAAIVRLIRIVEELKDTGFDVSFASYDVTIWTSVELNTGLVCAAAPATRPLIRLVAPRLLSNNPGSPLDNTAARISNYADGTMDVSRHQLSNDPFELSNQLKSVTGKNGSPQESGSEQLSDCGGLLKNETHLVALRESCRS
jgi:hypothetical protein